MKGLVFLLAVLVCTFPVMADTIHIDAENCTLSGDYCPLNITNDGWVYFASTQDGSDGWFQSYQGTAYFTLPQAIPDGTYTLSVKWKTGNVFSGNTYAYLISGANGASVTENGITNQGAWHTFYPTLQATTAVDYLAGPGTDFALATMWPGSPKANSITISGAAANTITIRMWDMCPLNYDYMAIDYFELTPTPEPMAMSLLALGGIALFRRK
jgi:hypothetical protein